MASWVFKYAFAMLESIADGEVYTPVVSMDMLSPFEQRPLVLLLMTIGITQLLWVFDETWTQVLIALHCSADSRIDWHSRRNKPCVTINKSSCLVAKPCEEWAMWYAVVLLAIAVSVALTAALMQAGALASDIALADWHVGADHIQSDWRCDV